MPSKETSNSALAKRNIIFALTIIYALSLAAISLIDMPGEPTSNGPNKLDTSFFYHIASYTILGALLFYTYRLTPRYLSLKKMHAENTLATFTIASLFGIAIECFQAMIPWRDFGILDITANITGAAFGILLAFALLEKR